MAWKKSPQDLVVLLAKSVAPFACQRRVMFGYPAYFVNDNLFTALHEDNVILRLSEDDHKDMLSKHADAVQFEPMPGRPMREYVVLPPSLYRDANVFDSWLSRSYQYALLLPPKERKGTRKSNRS